MNALFAVLRISRANEPAPPGAAILADLPQRLNYHRSDRQTSGNGRELALLHQGRQRRGFLELRGDRGQNSWAFELAYQAGLLDLAAGLDGEGQGKT